MFSMALSKTNKTFKKIRINKTTRNNIVIIIFVTLVLFYMFYNYLNEFDKRDPKGLRLDAPKLCEEIELESGFKTVMTFIGNCPKVNGELQIGNYYGNEYKLIQRGEGNNSSFTLERSDTEVNCSNGFYICCKYKLE
jgi:hypothetical protein